MRISYWNSDVCSSDLRTPCVGGLYPAALSQTLHSPGRDQIGVALGGTSQAGVGRGRVNQCLGKTHLILGSQTQYVGFLDRAAGIQIGGASCRERVWQYV